ncbi:MAG: hypothetical protein A2231_10810 [Candidatus Firestonebacteria bacterium RIFOXYA2_FULL_40_8]|nr:MAG: hypothetical protein A2231_10810 [Candidatus Firestonebacteria bacterium RIFOXYA2_FULL_40_8]
MKKIMLPILILFLISGSAFSETTRKLVVNPDKSRVFTFCDAAGKEIAQELRDKDGNVTKTTGKIPDGVVKQYYKSGKVQAEWNYVGGKAEGKYKEYYESGKLQSEGVFKDGTMEGIKKWQTENEMLRYEYTFKTGIMIEKKSFYQSGKLWTEGTLKDGKEVFRKSYHEDGKLQEECPIVNGQRDGICKSYYKDGRYEECPFINGKQEGLAKIYSNPNKVKINMEEEFKNGLLNGIQRIYGVDGNVQKEFHFKDGKQLD